MKLILADYLAGLKERDELDVLLPDLLSQMGLNILTHPQRGTSQKGVDVAAVGKLPEDQTEKIYLLSIKPGNLTPNTWNGRSQQSLRRSLEEILDDYIPNRILPEHNNKPIVICLCIGGGMSEKMASTLSGYIKEHKRRRTKIVLWNGEKIAQMMADNFLGEDVLLATEKSLLRKALSIAEEPEASFGYYRQLLQRLDAQSGKNKKGKLRLLRQINVCTLVLLKWCRDVDNLEAAYLAGELGLLYVWHICKKSILQKGGRYKQAYLDALGNAHRMQLIVTGEYVEKIQKWASKPYVLSYAVRGLSAVDTNLKLFDVLGRVALAGLWQYSILAQIMSEKDERRIEECSANIVSISDCLHNLIDNNPILNTPLKDDQVIEIALATLMLRAGGHAKYAGDWLMQILNRVKFQIESNGVYPCTLQSYGDLLEHPTKNNSEYFKRVTMSSELYPTIALIAGVLGRDDVFAAVQALRETVLPHCNFQLWYLDEASEANFYLNTGLHGLELTSLDVRKKEEFLELIYKECQENGAFKNMSVMKPGLFFLIFVGCRHHRLPVPPDFFWAIWADREK